MSESLIEEIYYNITSRIQFRLVSVTFAMVFDGIDKRHFYIMMNELLGINEMNTNLTYTSTILSKNANKSS